MAKLQISESILRDYYVSIKTEASQYFDSYVKREWSDSLALYTDTYTITKKLDWQSQLRDPVADNLVHRLSNYMTRLLIESADKYYLVEHPNSLRELAYKTLLTIILDVNNFPYVFNDGLKYGLITSISVFKVLYQYDVLSSPVHNAQTGEFDIKYDRIGKVRIIPVNPFNIRLDPYGEKYIIEEQIMSLAEFEQIAKANLWVNIERVREDYGTSASFNQPSNRMPSFPEVVLHHVHAKYVCNRDGKVVARDVYFIVANGKHVVHFERNLLPDGRFPYVVGQPLRSLVGRYGRGYLSRLKGLIQANIDSLNLILDAFVLSVLGIYEYVFDKVVKGSEHQFTASIVPGKMYPVTEAGTLRAVGNPTIPSMATQIFFLLDRTLQNRSYQTEFFMGMPTVKGRPTATEIGLKIRESSGFFTDIASELERSILQPLLELVLITELIYMDDPSHIEISSAVGEEEALRHLKGLDFSERMEDIRKFKVRVRGLSDRIKKQSSLEKIVAILNVLGNMPHVVQAVDGRKLVEKVFEALDSAPEELFNMDMLGGMGTAPAAEGLEGVAQPEVGVPEQAELLMQLLQRGKANVRE